MIVDDETSLPIKKRTFVFLIRTNYNQSKKRASEVDRLNNQFRYWKK